MNLGDLSCPNCNCSVDLLDEFVPEEQFATEGRDGSSVSASTSQALVPLKYKTRGQLKSQERRKLLKLKDPEAIKPKPVRNLSLRMIVLRSPAKMMMQTVQSCYQNIE